MSEGKRAEGSDRRVVLKLLVGSGGAAFACALAAPAAVFMAAPATGATRAGSRWVQTIRLDGLRDGEPKKVAVIADQRDAWTLNKDVELGAAWLVRRGDNVVALSATCPHLGCAVNASEDGTGFACPCHTSTFDSTGRRIGGPAPRDMDPLETRIENGSVLVNFRTYRMSIPERVEVG
jgi:cytochrome b6-f complex iron-sulfur subunit/menaquinol-cytochrome c reductase iron-sulfur subunit